MVLHKYAVKSIPETSIAINANKGKSCRVRLRVKYSFEGDWDDHILWMVPGWDPQDVWKKAYAHIETQNNWYHELTGQHATIEEARLDDFRLV